MRVSTARAFARCGQHSAHAEWHSSRTANLALLLTTLAAAGLTMIYLAIRAGVRIG